MVCVRSLDRRHGRRHTSPVAQNTVVSELLGSADRGARHQERSGAVQHARHRTGRRRSGSRSDPHGANRQGLNLTFPGDRITAIWGGAEKVRRSRLVMIPSISPLVGSFRHLADRSPRHR